LGIKEEGYQCGEEEEGDSSRRRKRRGVSVEEKTREVRSMLGLCWVFILSKRASGSEGGKR